MKKIQLLALIPLTLSLTATLSCCVWAQEKLLIEAPETMGMSMFRSHWDTPIPLAADGATEFWSGVPKDKRERGAYAVWTKEKRAGKPGALAFDALNRSLLVRFPGAAEKIAEALKNGKTIQKVELVLPFKDEELFAPGAPDQPGVDGYNMRTNWGIDQLYLTNRPTWHAVAYALRRPWVADENIGPTFNAAINGRVFWTKYGAKDETSDRFPNQFGPAEVSHQKTEGLDITKSLTDASFGPSLGARLRRLSDCGFVVSKWESYDHRYFRGVYEWATATGGRGILVYSPRLEVTFSPGQAEVGALTLPAAPDVKALAQQTQNAPQGRPSAVIPPAEQIQQWASQSLTKPAWMSKVQFSRVQELMKLGGRIDDREPLWTMFVPVHIVNRMRQGYWAGPGDYRYKSYAKPEEVYAAWVDQLIARQTRGWSGFETANEFAEWQTAKHILPGPAKDAIFRYWTDWMMPGRTTAPEAQMLNANWLDGSLIHPMSDQLTKGRATDTIQDADTYWLKTGDWRGNKSFFRSGFNYKQSTQNFNTTASTGAYIFGNLVGAPEAIADGKVGVDRWLLKGWIWGDGTGQEHLDHYYYTVTLKGLKALQNSASDDATRLVGDSLITKGVEEALLAWHPNLKRFIAPSSRTSLNYLLGTQEGGSYLMHVLSQKGVLTDVGQKEVAPGYPAFGQETPPALVALMTLQKPWVRDDMAALVDSKPLPWEATHSNAGQWRRTYFGKNYGLASSSTQGNRIQAMAQWRRAEKDVTSAHDLGTLDMRMGFNDTNWVNDAPGWISQPGKQVVAQSKNTWLTVASPNTWNGGMGDGKTPVQSVQQSLGFFDLSALEPNAPLPWEIYVSGKKVESLPVTAKQGDAIVIRDGVTFIGIKALPSPDLGRSAEVTLEAGKEKKANFAGHTEAYRPGLVINSYITKKDAPLTKENADWYALDMAYAGFAVQFGDASEGSFEAFQKKIAASQVKTEWDATKRQVSTSLVSGSENLGLQVVTAPEKKPDGSWAGDFMQMVSATRNGASLYPDNATLLDTPLDVAGWNQVEKNGSTLSTSMATGSGARLFLQTTPDKKRFVAWNPQGVPADLQWSLPSGFQVRSDGLLGLARLSYDLDRKTLAVDHAFTDGRSYGGAGSNTTDATALLFANAPEDLKITLNGQPFTGHLARATIGKTAWRVLPMAQKPRSKEEMATMLALMDKAPTILKAAAPKQPFIQVDYAGPFPQKSAVYGPEKAPQTFNFTAVYTGEGEEGQDVKWRNWGTAAKSQIYGNPWPTGSQYDSVFMFRHYLSQSKGPATYFLHATVRAAKAQDVRLTLNLGEGDRAPGTVWFWLNGQAQKFPEKGGFTKISLKAGENELLWKVQQDAGMPFQSSNMVLLTLGDPIFGFPMLENVEWKAADSSWVPVNPQKSQATG